MPISGLLKLKSTGKLHLPISGSILLYLFILISSFVFLTVKIKEFKDKYLLYFLFIGQILYQFYFSRHLGNLTLRRIQGL